MRKHTISFKVAIEGILYAFRTQPNFLIHSLAAVFTISLAIVLKISYIEWVVLTLTTVMVVSAEMINTAIESMTDLITQEHRQQAKIAKDVSAGMVLVTATGAVIVGVIIFLPKLM